MKTKFTSKNGFIPNDFKLLSMNRPSYGIPEVDESQRNSARAPVYM